MLFTTTTQFAALAMVFVAGWLLGLASHPGGRKWKDRYAAERDAHAVARKDGDARVTDSNRRVAELERENARLAAAPPVAAPVVAPAAAPVVERPARVAPVESISTVRRVPGERRGWFDFGPSRSVR